VDAADQGTGEAGVMSLAPTALRPAVIATWPYWTATAVIAIEGAVGGAMDLLHLPPFFPVLLDLGYPAYLATILGIAKLLATLVIVAPRLPRLKEWAYAGIMINMLGAAASHLAVRDTPGDLVAPLAFAGIALASWALRPPTRKLEASEAGTE
jgi:uncharacterized membrane protein YphA (DoxX/SURF4 family)